MANSCKSQAKNYKTIILIAIGIAFGIGSEKVRFKMLRYRYRLRFTVHRSLFTEHCLPSTEHDPRKNSIKRHGQRFWEVFILDIRL